MYVCQFVVACHPVNVYVCVCTRACPQLVENDTLNNVLSHDAASRGASLSMRSPVTVTTVVIDEAHELCMAGPVFRPHFTALTPYIASWGAPVIMLTATATAGMRIGIYGYRYPPVLSRLSAQPPSLLLDA